MKTSKEKQLIDKYEALGKFEREGNHFSSRSLKNDIAKLRGDLYVADGLTTGQAFAQRLAGTLARKIPTWERDTTINMGDIQETFQIRDASSPITTLPVPAVDFPFLLGKYRRPHIYQLFTSVRVPMGDQLFTYQEVSQEGDADTVPEGGPVPQVSFPLDDVTMTVMKTIGGTLKLSTEMIHDSEVYAQAIDNRLDYLVRCRVDAYILDVILASGASTVSGSSFQGIYNGLLSVAEGLGRQANVLVLSNADFYALNAADTSNRFFQNLRESGVFVQVTDLMGPGEALAFSAPDLGVVGIKHDFVLDATNSNQDDFTNGLVTHRIMWHGAFAVVNPKACAVIELS